MGKIIILDELTTNKIAAGEVIERPASVVKEMCENAIDAGARKISVEIRNGGISYIKISDDGSGISPDDAIIAFERHSTSKIRSADDLDGISTMGFRGEALASIAAVARVELTSRTPDQPSGMRVEIAGGRTDGADPAGCPVGTTFVVRDLFYNTPARYKFLKKDTTEAGFVYDAVMRLALGHPEIAFRLIDGGRPVLSSPGNGDLRSAIFSIYGRDTAESCSEINWQDGPYGICGYAGDPRLSRGNRNYIYIYLNKRYIRSKLITDSIEDAYRTLLMKGRFPFIILNITVNPALVDINVHPAKLEARFAHETEMRNAVRNAVYGALFGAGLEPPAPQPPASQPERFEIKASEQPVQYDISRAFAELAPQASQPAASEPVQAPAQNVSAPVMQAARSMPAAPAQAAPAQAEAAAQRPENRLGTGVRIDPGKALFIGRVFDTYAIFQQENEMVMLDQHAAHERIMFEEIQARLAAGGSAPSQLIVVPHVAELSASEFKTATDNRELLRSLGFETEDFGNNTVLIRSMPAFAEGAGAGELFAGVLDELSKNPGDDGTDGGRVDEAIYSMACKAAVKANMKLDRQEITHLVERLNAAKNPYTCPHGRPIAVKLTKYELEKMFKRIV